MVTKLKPSAPPDLSPQMVELCALLCDAARTGTMTVPWFNWRPRTRSLPLAMVLRQLLARAHAMPHASQQVRRACVAMIHELADPAESESRP